MILTLFLLSLSHPLLSSSLIIVLVLVLVVSSAIGMLGDSTEAMNDWLVAIETIKTILSNVLAHPDDLKYHQINVANPNFYRRSDSTFSVCSIFGILILTLFTALVCASFHHFLLIDDSIYKTMSCYVIV